MVASWSPLQLEREERAKCRSSVFLFNLTRDARSLASLLEIAFLTGKGAPIVSVISTESIVSACGARLSPEENKVMRAAREELIARAETRGYPIFTQLDDGLKFVDAMVNSRLFINEIVNELGWLPLTPVLSRFSADLAELLREYSLTARPALPVADALSKEGNHDDAVEMSSCAENSKQDSNVSASPRWLSSLSSLSSWLLHRAATSFPAMAMGPKSKLLSIPMRFALEALLRLRKRKHDASSDADAELSCAGTGRAEEPIASTSTVSSADRPRYDLFVNASSCESGLDLHAIFRELHAEDLRVLTWSEDELLIKQECSIPKHCIPAHACLPDTPATPASLSSSMSASTVASSLRFKWPHVMTGCTAMDSKLQKLDTAAAPEACAQLPEGGLKMAYANPYSVLRDCPPTRSTRRPRSIRGRRRQTQSVMDTQTDPNVQLLPGRQDSRSSSTASSSSGSDVACPSACFLTIHTRDTPPPTPTRSSTECDSGICSPTLPMSRSPSASSLNLPANQFFETPSSSQEDLSSDVSSIFITSSRSAWPPAFGSVTSIHPSDASSWSARREQFKYCNAFLFAFTRRSTAVLDSIFAADFFGEESLKPPAERRPIVLYIEDFQNGDEAYGEKLTESALGDYNRMHAYLVTMAKAAGAVVVTNEPLAHSEPAANVFEKLTLKKALLAALRIA